MTRWSSVTLYSGGIDSFILLEYVRQCIDKDTKPIYFDMGHRYSGVERDFVNKTPGALIDDESIYLGDIEEKSAFIPNRNILLATVAVSKYSNKIFVGGSKSDRICDNNETVFNLLAELLTKTDGRGNVITITSPFWEMYKDDMVGWYTNVVNKGQTRLLTETFSCFQPLSAPNTVSVFLIGSSTSINYTSRHCFSCPACFRRNAVLSNTAYILPFYDEKIVGKYHSEFSKQIYLNVNDRRASATLAYINQRERHDCLKRK